MDAELDEKTIRAAVAGEEWAIAVIVAQYAEEIDRLCTCTLDLDDGTHKSYVDQDTRREIVQEFIKGIMEFPL